MVRFPDRPPFITATFQSVAFSFVSKALHEFEDEIFEKGYFLGSFELTKLFTCKKCCNQIQ